jgi:hypothetical protein
VAESFVKGMGNLKFQGQGKRIKRCNEQVIPACESSPVCEADIVFLFDKNEANEAGLFDFKERVTVITNWLEANTSLYRLGLIEFDLLSSSVLLTMSDNNRAAFESAVDGIVLGSSGAMIVEHRNSDEALQRVIDEEAGAWATGASRTVILVSQGLPHGGDGSVDTIDFTNQISKVTTLAADSVRVSTIAVPYYTFDLTGNVPFFLGGLEGHLQYLAEQADGTFDSVQTNGPDDNNEFVNVLVDAMMNSVTKVCKAVENDTPAAGCCAVIPCDICLIWTIDNYPDDPTITNGIMTWSGSRWTGSVSGITVEAYWDLRKHCVFFLEADGVVVFSATKCPPLDSEGMIIETDQPTIGCRAPSGETTIERQIGYDETEIGVLSWEIPIEHEVARRKAQPPQPCNWDVVFCIDNDDQSQFNTEQLLSSAIQPIVDWIESVSDSAQFGLVIFDADGAAEISGLSSDSAAFVAAVNAIDAGTWPVFPAEASANRRSDLAVRYANLMTGWRPSAQKRMVLINQGSPEDPSDLSDQYLQADTSFAAGIQIHAVSTPFTASDGSYAALFSTTTNLNRYMALTTGGQYFTGNAIDQTPPTIPAQILASLQASEQCDTDGRCAEHFCGLCDCVADKLCVTVGFESSDTTIYIDCSDVLPFTGDFCDGMATSASWEGALACNMMTSGGTESAAYDVEVNLMRASVTDAYAGIAEGQCIAHITVSGPYVDIDKIVPIACPDLYAEVEDDYTGATVTISRQRCGVCDSPQCPRYCCEDRPSRLYMHIIPTSIESNSGGGVEEGCQECACEPNLNIPMNIHNECASISDEQAGWRIGQVFGEPDISHFISCIEGPDGTSGMQLQCTTTGTEGVFEFRLFATGSSLSITFDPEGVDYSDCADLISLYFSNAGTHTLGPCNSNIVHFDIMITEAPLTSPPSGSVTGCP